MGSCLRFQINIFYSMQVQHMYQIKLLDMTLTAIKLVTINMLKHIL